MFMLQCKKFCTKLVKYFFFCRMYGLAVMLTIVTPKLQPSIQIHSNIDALSPVSLVYREFKTAYIQPLGCNLNIYIHLNFLHCVQYIVRILSYF
mgnify:FL=1